MSTLQFIDTALFRFVNETLRNPVFDSLMPVFIIGGHYGTTGLLSFYMPEACAAVETTPLVYYRHMRKPHNQCYFRPNCIGTRRGENENHVQEKDKPAPAPPDTVKQFASVTETGRFLVYRRSRVLQHVQVFVCDDLQR